MIRKLFISAVVLVMSNIMSGQVSKDTFRIRLDKLKEDTSRVNEMVIYARNILYTDPSKAWDYCNEAITLAKKSGFPYGLANAYRLAGAYNNDITGDYKQAGDYFSKALTIYRSYPGYRFKEGTGAVMHSFGAMHHRSGDYLKSIEYYLEATRILDSIGNKQILPRTYNNLATLYAFLKLYDKEEFYASAGLKLALENKDPHMISVISITLGSSLIDQGKYNEAFRHLRTADSIASIRKDMYIGLLASVNYSNYYRVFRKDYKASVGYAKKAYESARLLQNPFELTRTATLLAEQYLTENNFDLAYKTALISLDYARKINSIDFRQRSYYLLGLSLVKKGDYKTAAGYLNQAAELKDSVIIDENRRQINFLESQYQKEKKEREIALLQNEKEISTLIIKRRNIAIITLSVILLLLGFIAWITARNMHHKKILAEKELELQKQKILEIEKQRQLDATLSVLQGEEAERSRLARDLHDGLGGLLSGVKLMLTNMKGNVVLKQTKVEQFDSVLGLLDTSIRELRRVAHNMMPEALVRFGLKDALNDFCNNLENGKNVGIKFQYFGNDHRIEPNIEINIYRIAQELINNALKHADASEMLVQLIQEDSRVHLTVQDNGKGFNTDRLKTSKGAGIGNIRSRVESQNGNFEIYSEPDKGTEASVEFRWNN